ncbi:discoidin domain-containing protein [Cohnella herbarum]|uniref:F5/8 type C domain-containing protein n=1 Tax=Cohnella herbarum TaxID=2728023 RepID=A0A7Z2VQN8_9BACL|nr:discoidin domain-containing protein [Cohnella herbarum]QJD87459.1 hypothetical protein HH215_32645 [Cohnella herbarum]
MPLRWLKLLVIFCLGIGLISGIAFGGAARASGSNELRVWSPPAGTPANTAFEVQVRKAGDSAWIDLFEYKVNVGHQDGSLAASSMVNFDFNGTVEIKVVYAIGTVSSYDLRPTSYGLTPAVSGNTLIFPVTQNESSPRKIVLRINNGWENEVLHIVTNPIETGAVSDAASNVYVIGPSDEIPLRLPAGKDTYYFKPGVHHLPRGMWVELDLGAFYSIDKLVLNQGKAGAATTVDPQKFVLETKSNETDAYRIAYDGTGNLDSGSITITFPAKSARYVRLKLTGNNGTGRDFLSSYVNELELYAVGGTTNLALNRAIAGAMPNYGRVVDGNPATQMKSSSEYGNWHAGESFFLSQNNYKVYIEAGAVVKGSFMGDGVSNISIGGRGILDASELTHYPTTLAESRAGAIWLIGGSDNKIEGITILDSPMWTIVMNFSERPVVRNVNIFGSTINADGIHMSASSNGLVEGVFIRSNDDNVVMYHYGPGSHNIFRNSVFWGDDAHIVLIGLGTAANADISDITVRNIDVLAQQGVYDLGKFNGVMKLWPNGGNEIRNVLFQDIRIESFRNPSESMIFQLRTDERFPGEGNGAAIKDVTLENIDYYGGGEMQSLIKGASGTSYVKNVQITNYKRGGAFVTNAASGNIGIQGNVSDVVFSPSDALLDDSFDGQATGSQPSGWIGSPGITVENVPSATNKSVRVSKTGSGDIVTSRAITPSSGIVTVETRMNVVDKTNWKSLIIDNSSGTELLQIGFNSGGEIYANNGTSWSPFMTYNVNQWYDIRVVVNTVSDRYDLYVNGVRKVHNVKLETATEDVGFVKFGSGETNPGTYYFDNVKATVSPLAVKETFDGQVSGTGPVGWTSSPGITVENVPSATNKSVRVNKTGSGGIVSARTFAPASGVVTVKARMNIADKTNWKSLLIDNSAGAELLQIGFNSGGEIYANNGTSWSPFMTYNVNQWYDVLLTIDTATDTYDLYIDGVLKAHNKALETATADVGAVKFGSGESPVGAYYYDDVMVAH